MALPAIAMQNQALLALIMAQPGHRFAVLTDSQVLCLTNGGVLEAANLNPTAVDKMMRALNPRLPPGLPTELEAVAQIAKWVIMFVNRQLGQLIVEFIPRALEQMQTVAPRRMTQSSLAQVTLDFLTTHVAPAVTNATAVGNVFNIVTAAANAYLEDQAIRSTLIEFEMDATRAAAISRGHTGAPTSGSQRANNAAGGGGVGAGAAAVGGPPYRDPPTGKRMPPQYTGGPLSRFPIPASGVLLCYASRSTLGRCPYAACTRQHDWTNVTAAEQATIKIWLVDWLAKRKWDQFVLWSNAGGLPGAWPAICA